MFLVRNPKLSYLQLTEAFFDEKTPLILRFKLNTKICTDYIQIFLEKYSGDAILDTHYQLPSYSGLGINKNSNNDLESLNFLINGDIGVFDLHFSPIIDLNQKKDIELILKIKETKDYIVQKEFITLKINSSRRILLNENFFLNGLIPRTV